MGHKIAVPSTVQFEHPIAESFGRGADKRIFVRVEMQPGGGVPYVCAIVRDHGKEVFRSEDLERAVEAYNAH
jgi:hypothetical protein